MRGLGRQPIFFKAFQLELCKPFNFTIEISGGFLKPLELVPSILYSI